MQIQAKVGFLLIILTKYFFYNCLYKTWIFYHRKHVCVKAKINKFLNKLFLKILKLHPTDNKLNFTSLVTVSLTINRQWNGTTPVCWEGKPSWTMDRTANGRSYRNWNGSPGRWYEPVEMFISYSYKPDSK